MPFDWPSARFRTVPIRDLSVIPGPKLEPPTGFASAGSPRAGTASRAAGVASASGCAGTRPFPSLWFWHVLGGMPGYPWYALNYDCALEPWTSWPDGGLNKSIENGSALNVGPWETIYTRLIAVAYSGVNRIAGIDADGEIRT